MKGVFYLAKELDHQNYYFVDALDTSLQRFAKDYNNRALDDRIEFQTNDVLKTNKYLSEETKHFKRPNKNLDTVDFLVNYFAKGFIEDNKSINHALYNMLYLMEQLGIAYDEIYINDVFRTFKRNFIDNPKYKKVTPDDKISQDKYIDLLVKYEFPYFKTLDLPINTETKILIEIKNRQEHKTDQGESKTIFEKAIDIAKGVGGAVALGLLGAGHGKLNKNSLPIDEIINVAYNAGFRGDSLITATAIALAESGGDANILGDTTITGVDKKGINWGPSVGLWQSRSMVDHTGTGKTRDINILRDPQNNAYSAWKISSHGTDFDPWSVYSRPPYGYKKYLNAAEQAVSNFAK